MGKTLVCADLATEAFVSTFFVWALRVRLELSHGEELLRFSCGHSPVLRLLGKPFSQRNTSISESTVKNKSFLPYMPSVWGHVVCQKRH